MNLQRLFPENVEKHVLTPSHHDARHLFQTDFSKIYTQRN